MRTDRRAGIAHISFPKEQRPEALAPRGPCAFRDQRSRGEANKAVAPSRSLSPALSVGRAPVPELETVSPSTSPLPVAYTEGPQPGAGQRRRVEAAAPPRDRPRCPSAFAFLAATPTLAPPPPVAACPSSLFLSPHFASWDSEDQIPPVCPPPLELPGLRARARRSRPVHRGHPARSSTRPAALNFSPGRCAGLGAEGRARPGAPFPQGCLPVG